MNTNVLSEPTKPAPAARVVGWLRQHERDLAVNPIILGELEYGILLLPASRRRARLERWFTAGIQRLRVLDLDTAPALLPCCLAGQDSAIVIPRGWIP